MTDIITLLCVDIGVISFTAFVMIYYHRQIKK